MPADSLAEPPVSSISTVGFVGGAVGSDGVLYSGGGGVPVPSAVGMFGGGPGATGLGGGGHISGVNMAPYGMPITGTPLGLPGPPTHSTRWSCWFAETCDPESHSYVHSETITACRHPCGTKTWHKLSGTVDSGLDSTIQSPELCSRRRSDLFQLCSSIASSVSER